MSTIPLGTPEQSSQGSTSSIPIPTNLPNTDPTILTDCNLVNNQNPVSVPTALPADPLVLVDSVTVRSAYIHPDHSGQVVSIGDGSTSLTLAAITNQDELAAGLASTDELLLNDGGTLKRMDISVVQTYMQDNLSFSGGYVHPNHSGHITSVGDGATVLTVSAITGQTELAAGLASTDELLVSDAGVIKRMDVSVVQAYMQSNLTFTAIPYGTVGQVPYMNAGGNSFSYTSSLHYTTGIFTVPNLAISALANDGALLYSQVTTGNVQQSTNLTFDGTDLSVLGHLAAKGLQFDISYTPAGEPEGQVWWNEVEYTLNISTGLGPVLQVGQEIYLLIYNDTGGQLDNFTVVRPKAGFPIGGIILPTVQKANASTWLGVEGTLMTCTMDIPNGQIGIATRFGRVRGGDASGTPYGEVWGLGDQVYVSETDGELTNVRPEFPSYNISIGGVVDNSVAPDGEVFMSLTRNFNDTFDNFWNGTIRESFTFEITEAGGTVTGHLDDAEGNHNLTYLFEDGFYLVDTTSTIDVVLTPGTDTIPATNYVYILESTKALTVNTSSWPVVEHIKIAQIVLQSAATTATDGALRNQNWNDHLQDVAGQGHLSHIAQKLRKLDAQWNSGTQGGSTVDNASTPDDVWVTVTSGSSFQMHEQTFPAFDTEVSNYVHVVNHNATPYLATANLNVLLSDATATTLNNTSFSFVLWGVQNSGTEPCQLMLNLPIGSYAFVSPNTAVNDALNYAVYTIPAQFQGVGFLIARFTYTYKNDDWVLYDTEDLRGRVPNSTAGGGGGGAGVTEFTALNDTPGSYIGEALKILQLNAGETALEFRDAPFEASIGLAGEMPYMNGTPDDFSYTSGLGYFTGVFTAPNAAISALSTGGGIVYTTVTTGGLNVTSRFIYNSATYAMTLDGTGGFGGSTVYKYGAVVGLTIKGKNSSAGEITSPGTLTLISTHATTPHISIGDLTTSASFVTIRDISNTATSTLLIYNASNNLAFDVREDLTLYIPGLGSDDTEDHVLAINDTTGLLTKRSVASIGSALTIGNTGEIPYSNSGTPGDDFSYVSTFGYFTGILTAPNAAFSGISATNGAIVTASGGGVGALSSASTLVYTSSVLTATGAIRGTTNIYAGDRTAAYNSAFVDNSIVVATTAISTRSGIEMVGNATTNTSIASLSFHNTAAAAADKRVAHIDAGRIDDNDAGYIAMYTATSAGTLVKRFQIDDTGALILSTTATALTTGLLNVAGTGLTYAATFFHDGNSASRKGIKVQCGLDTFGAPSGPPGSAIFMDFYDGNGTQNSYIYGDAGGSYLQSVSDARLKTNIANLTRDAKGIVMGVKVKEFNWKRNPDAEKITGYVAQEVLEVFPDMVHRDVDTDLYTVGSAKLIPYIHVVVQTHEERIVELEKEVENLKLKLNGNKEK